jgi:hypothetical protein
MEAIVEKRAEVEKKELANVAAADSVNESSKKKIGSGAA